MVDDVGDIKVDGKKYKGYALETEMFENKVYQIGFSMKKGQYIASVSLAAASPDELQELLDAFYHL